MKKLFSLLALAALVSAPAMALDSKEKKDLGKAVADQKGAAAEKASAQKHREAAGVHARNAAQHWQAANKLWEQRQRELQLMHAENAAASRERNEAAKDDKDAARLIQAENLRAAAFRDRLEADGFHKSAHTHRQNAAAAAQAIKDGQMALGVLRKDGAKFADAIKDIEKDLQAQMAKQTAEDAAAKADDQRADKELAEAVAEEKQAAALEPKPAAAPPPQIQVQRVTLPTIIQAAQKK